MELGHFRVRLAIWLVIGLASTVTRIHSSLPSRDLPHVFDLCWSFRLYRCARLLCRCVAPCIQNARSQCPLNEPKSVSYCMPVLSLSVISSSQQHCVTATLHHCSSLLSLYRELPSLFRTLPILSHVFSPISTPI